MEAELPADGGLDQDPANGGLDQDLADGGLDQDPADGGLDQDLAGGGLDLAEAVDQDLAEAVDQDPAEELDDDESSVSWVSESDQVLNHLSDDEPDECCLDDVVFVEGLHHLEDIQKREKYYSTCCQYLLSSYTFHDVWEVSGILQDLKDARCWKWVGNKSNVEEASRLRSTLGQVRGEVKGIIQDIASGQFTAHKLEVLLNWIAPALQSNLKLQPQNLHASVGAIIKALEFAFAAVPNQAPNVDLPLPDEAPVVLDFKPLLDRLEGVLSHMDSNEDELVIYPDDIPPPDPILPYETEDMHEEVTSHANHMFNPEAAIPLNALNLENQGAQLVDGHEPTPIDDESEWAQFLDLLEDQSENHMIMDKYQEEDADDANQMVEENTADEGLLQALLPCHANTFAGTPKLSKLLGSYMSQWDGMQIMLPDWMVKARPHLTRDWYVFTRPAGKRCLVISCNGMTISMVRNGSILHQFHSILPNGSKTNIYGPLNSYSILDCVFHELDQTYYAIDLLCWQGYAVRHCSAEFRISWLKSKLSEIDAFDPPSTPHRYRFSVVPVYQCTMEGLHEAYSGSTSYLKDGLLFYNKHSQYQFGISHAALAWKDACCSQYVIDTDSKGEIPKEQLIVLQLQVDGKLVTSDDPPVALGTMDFEFMQKANLQPGNLLRFAIRDESVELKDGQMQIGELQFVGKPSRARTFADSQSKALFQYAARHAPLRIEDLAASIQSSSMELESTDVDMED